MKKIWKRIFVVVGSILFFVCCAVVVLFFVNAPYVTSSLNSVSSIDSVSSPAFSSSYYGGSNKIFDRGVMVEGIAEMGFDDMSGVSDVSVIDVSKKIIKNGNIDYRVTNTDILNDSIKNIIDSYDIFIQSSSTYKNDNYVDTNMQLKVLSEDFDNVYSDLKSLEGVVHEFSNTQDVTEEFIDLEAKLKVYEAQEERLIVMFDKAVNVSELISIESELARLRSQIESLQGRLNYLESVTSYSTINISISQVGVAFSEGEHIKLSDKLYFAYKEGIFAFKSVIVFIAKFILWTWMYWLVIGVVILFLKRRKKKSNL